ncbi:MAG: hypothetical protein HQM12_19745 [SAR324 cluster bacterium]|nr:hypothetical protein [SAR324 cluster bacterium]
MSAQQLIEDKEILKANLKQQWLETEIYKSLKQQWLEEVNHLKLMPEFQKMNNEELRLMENKEIGDFFNDFDDEELQLMFKNKRKASLEMVLTSGENPYLKAAIKVIRNVHLKQYNLTEASKIIICLTNSINASFSEIHRATSLLQYTASDVEWYLKDIENLSIEEICEAISLMEKNPHNDLDIIWSADSSSDLKDYFMFVLFVFWD